MYVTNILHPSLGESFYLRLFESIVSETGKTKVEKRVFASPPFHLLSQANS
ncbi:hypothetical protein CRD_00966 [Raphidiopsis brookii D9]|nr:hypothetical protein CRD_00966 [Raphidiopsis brookii D9]